MLPLERGNRAEPLSQCGFHIFTVHVREAHLNTPKVRSDTSANPNSRGRQPLVTEHAVGERIVRALGTRSRSWLARAAELPESTIGDAIKRGPSRSDVAVKVASALDVTLDWLLTGREVNAPTLVTVDNADWVEVPEHDLREMTDETLGRVVVSAPIRRDWLYSTFRASSGLWLTRLLSDYVPAGLSEDTLVICRSLRVDELAEGNLCLWRVAERVVVGRFSVVPDTMPRGPGVTPSDVRYLTPYLDPSLGGSSPDLIVPPSAIDAGRYHLVGRILGVMIRPI